MSGHGDGSLPALLALAGGVWLLWFVCVSPTSRFVLHASGEERKALTWIWYATLACLAWTLLPLAARILGVRVGYR